MKLRYFTREEIDFVSYGCEDGYDRMSVKALIKFDELRHRLGFPLNATCAFRTKDHDLAKGRTGKSQHCLGTAMDFQCNDLATAIKIVTAAYELGFRGLAIEKRFVHVDLRDSDKLITWNY